MSWFLWWEKRHARTWLTASLRNSLAQGVIELYARWYKWRRCLRREIQLQLCLSRVTPGLIEDGKRVVAFRSRSDRCRSNLFANLKRFSDFANFQGKLKVTIDFCSPLRCIINDNMRVLNFNEIHQKYKLPCDTCTVWKKEIITIYILHTFVKEIRNQWW